jgi:glycerol-3-phosphate acyltransferase PlsX
MNIALDVMGGDLAPVETVAGAVDAARTFPATTISLVGQPDLIEAELAKHETGGLDLPIVPASQVIEMHDKPSKVIRSKPDSSIVVACQMVRSGEAQAVVTAGNTGGALTAGILKIGRIKGIMRPALMTPFPTLKGFCTVLDVGANADTRPEYLPQFAVMGTIYTETVLGIKNPKVGLLSNGEEEGKGNQLVISASAMLQKTPGINFQGNIESHEVFEGLADLVVTDGFTGNIFLKTTEAAATALQKVVFEELKRDPLSAFGALLARNGLRRIRSRLDDSEYGGAVLLGLSGVLVVAHGRSNANSIHQTIRVAKESMDQDVPERIRQGVAMLQEAEALLVANGATEPQP